MYVSVKQLSLHRDRLIAGMQVYLVFKEYLVEILDNVE